MNNRTFLRRLYALTALASTVLLSGSVKAINMVVNNRSQLTTVTPNSTDCAFRAIPTYPFLGKNSFDKDTISCDDENISAAITPCVPIKVSTNDIEWKTFLAQHDMYWTNITTDPIGKSDDNRLKTGYYAGALMGNGLIGTNLYKLSNNVYRLNAARSDITEARTPYNLYNSARLPVGYFTLATVGKVTDERMRLSLYDAITSGTFTTDKGHIKFKTFVHANKNYIIFETDATDGETDYVWNFVPQQAISPRQIRNNDAPPGYINSVGKSNPDAEIHIDGDIHLAVQKLVTDTTFTTVSRVYVVAWKETKKGKHRRIIATISQAPNDTIAIAAAKATLDEAFGQASITLETSHKSWWNNFYQGAAFLSFPNAKFESFYWAQYYKFASTTRPDKPLADLQGVWPSWDTPWTAIWLNLNLQLTYSWQTKANLGMLSKPLWNTLNDNLVNLHRNTILMASHYGGANVDGYWDDAAVLPRTATYDMYAPLDPAGYSKNQYEVGNLAWTLFYYWQHCVGYGDTDALVTKFFPLLKAAINTFFHIRTIDENGKYGIPATASPEYTSGSAGANTNYDLANLRWGLMTLIDLDTTYCINDPKLAEWEDFLDNLVEFQTDANGYKISSTIGIPDGGTNHRHYSHLFMLYPYHIVSWDNSTENALLTVSLDKWNGNQGYSYTGKAAMLASKGEGDGALSQMTTFLNTYIKPNTLYAETGPVIETPMAAVSTLHEFYMQDWGDKIRIFFGMPSAWTNASFINMRAKGAFLVSATRKKGKTVFIQVESEKGGVCRLQTGITERNIKVAAIDGSMFPFTLVDASNGTIEINTIAGDIFQIIDNETTPLLPKPLKHSLDETMPYGLNNKSNITKNYLF
ncbi:MAG: glycosyl hydrolase family 95 catalytic domain-containing protein [Paludibacteraceae bacterium]